MITLPIPLALFAFFLAFELGFVGMAILQYKADDRVAAKLTATAAKLARATADLDRARLSLAEYEIAVWQRDEDHGAEGAVGVSQAWAFCCQSGRWADGGSVSKLDEIETLAKAATPGPYQQCGHNRGGCQCGFVFSAAHNGPAIGTAALGFIFQAACDAASDIPTPSLEKMKANAAFIAAANPQFVLKLIAVAKAARSQYPHTHSAELASALAELEAM